MSNEFSFSVANYFFSIFPIIHDGVCKIKTLKSRDMVYMVSGL